MLNWDEDTSSEEDFLQINGEGVEDHNQKLRICLLDDPDCEACQ